MCVCVSAWEQSSVQLLEFRDEQSPGYIAQWLERLTADQQVPGSGCALVFDLCRACLETEIRIEAAGPRPKKRLKTSKGRPMSAAVCV